MAGLPSKCRAFASVFHSTSKFCPPGRSQILSVWGRVVVLEELTRGAVEFLGFPRTFLVQPELAVSCRERADGSALESGALDAS